MDRDPISREDLRATALNDIESCVKELFTNLGRDPEELWSDFNSSLRVALDLGVTTESALSRLLNSIPDQTIKSRIISRIAEKYNLSDEEIKGLVAPED